MLQNSYIAENGGNMINVTIDGVSGSGKTSIAKGIAKVLKYHYLDTGAIYRGIACYYNFLKFPEPDKKVVDKFVKNLQIDIKFIKNTQHVIINGIDFSESLRLEENSMLAAILSPFHKIRTKVLLIQKAFSLKYNCVIEGRNIGTEVLPEAQVKFFIVADEKVRAKRRLKQLKHKNDNIDFLDVLEDIKSRDYMDENRNEAALKPANDSIIIDTTALTTKKAVKLCVDIIKKKLQINDL